MSRDEGSRPALSVVVPAYDEEDRLAASLRSILDALAGRPGGVEVLVVDDGSDDGTAAVAERLSREGVRLLRHAANRGKGAAVRTGVAASRGAWILLTDADLSAPIGELAALERAAGDGDIVIGSRAVESSRLVRPQPRHRRLMGWVFRGVARAAGIGDVRDSQCGFKLLRGDAARALFADMITDGFAFDVELLWLARRRGLAVREVGVAWADSRSTRVRWWRDPWRMLLEIVRFRRHHARRRRMEP